jgi:hypothetical protein
MPALTSNWPPLVQATGGATSYWRFPDSLIGGKQSVQQITQADQILNGCGDARAHNKVELTFLSAKQWLRLSSWMGERDRGAIAEPMNVHRAIANCFRHRVWVNYWLELRRLWSGR